MRCIVPTLAAALILVGCVTPRRSFPDYPEWPAGHTGPAVSSPERCRALGGDWGLHGFVAIPQCVVPTNDGGKICRDSSECQSICIAPKNVAAGSKRSGTCFGSYNAVGTCLAQVRSGVVSATLCTD